MKPILRAVLRFLGKGETKVAIVFGLDPESCHSAVLHVRRGAPDLPVQLFAPAAPLAQTAQLCQSVHITSNSFSLLYRVMCQIWPCWVAIGVTTWTGRHGNWMVKLAPFLIPPFHALIQNENGDFFAGTPMLVLRHVVRRLRDTLQSTGRRALGLAQISGVLFTSPISRLSLLYRRRLRRAFPWLKAGDPLPMPRFDAPRGGILRVEQDGAYWDAYALEAKLESSDAGLVLLHEPNQSFENFENLLPLFEDERTFAVTTQVHIRGWKSVLLPSAPFRALQPGEASQVLAPLSPVLLVDRRKLLALGIPRCSLTGGAWMVLSWKAAAAGWHSYTVGQSGAVCEQPDIPLQEADFRLYMLLHRSLRRLGPREPALSRGNIAFRAQAPRRAAKSDRLKVLLVSPFLPYPLSHGGAVRIYNLCRALGDRVDFVLVAIREEHDTVWYDRLHEVFREVYVVDKDELPSDDRNLPTQVREHQSCSLRALISELSRTWKPDLLQIEYTHLAHLRDAAPGIPAILVEHDLTFQLYRQMSRRDANTEGYREYQRWLAFERHWLAAYDGVWTVSADDRRAAIHEAQRSPALTFQIPNGVDTSRFVPREESTEAPEILYVGSFRHLPNIIGFEKLRDEILPRVWRHYPDARLRVVAGPRHEEFWRRFSRSAESPAFDPRVQIEGFVEDLRPLYARASVVVVPLEVSAGTNIKVLEGMAAAKPIVSTPIGCAGLELGDGREVLISRDWEHFAQLVTDLLGDPAPRARIAAAARRTAEQHFDWRAIANSAFHSYRETISRAPVCIQARRTSAAGRD